MKKFALIVVVLLGIFLSGNLQAQSLEQVLDKHFEAVGQKKLLDKKTYIIQARIEQMGMELPMTMKMKRPNKFRMEMEMQGQKMIQVYNGEKGWVVAPWMSPEPQELDGPQLQQAMEQADIDGELYDYKRKGYTAELIGKVKLGDKEVYRIKLTTKDEVVKNYYLDADNYLIASVKSKVNAQGQEIDVEQIMGEYDNIDGIMIARKIESKTPMGLAKIIIEKISFGEEIEDAIFDKP